MLSEILYGISIFGIVISILILFVGSYTGLILLVFGLFLTISIILFAIAYYYDKEDYWGVNTLRYVTIGTFAILVSIILIIMISYISAINNNSSCNDTLKQFTERLYESYRNISGRGEPLGDRQNFEFSRNFKDWNGKKKFYNPESTISPVRDNVWTTGEKIKNRFNDPKLDANSSLGMVGGALTSSKNIIKRPIDSLIERRRRAKIASDEARILKEIKNLDKECDNIEMTAATPVAPVNLQKESAPQDAALRTGNQCSVVRRLRSRNDALRENRNDYREYIRRENPKLQIMKQDLDDDHNDESIIKDIKTVYEYLVSRPRDDKIRTTNGIIDMVKNKITRSVISNVLDISIDKSYLATIDKSKCPICPAVIAIVSLMKIAKLDINLDALINANGYDGDNLMENFVSNGKSIDPTEVDIIDSVKYNLMRFLYNSLS